MTILQTVYNNFYFRFLILDPHYTGGEDIKIILDKASILLIYVQNISNPTMKIEPEFKSEQRVYVRRLGQNGQSQLEALKPQIYGSSILYST